MQKAMYDIVVIGGDLHATSSAALAASTGLNVALICPKDIGESACKNYWVSHNANLLKLEQFAITDVIRNLREESKLSRNFPHWVRATQFYVLHAPAIRSTKRVELGLGLMARLSPAFLSLPTPPKNPGQPLAPEIITYPYTGFRLQEQRLAIGYAQALRHSGGHVITRAPVTHAQRGKHWQIHTSERVILARAVINASGTHVLDTLKLLKGETRSNIVLHPQVTLIVRKKFTGNHGYILQNADGQLISVSPIGQQLMALGPIRAPLDLGTAQLLERFNSCFQEPLTVDDIVDTVFIERPIYEDPTASSPSYVPNVLLDLDSSPGLGPLLNILGTDPSKHRLLAERATAVLKPFLPNPHEHSTPTSPLKDTDTTREAFLEELGHAYPKLPTLLLTRLSNTYGTNVYKLLKSRTHVSELGTDFGSSLYEAEVKYLQDEEWATTANDILYRRTDLGWHVNATTVQKLNNWLSNAY